MNRRFTRRALAGVTFGMAGMACASRIGAAPAYTMRLVMPVAINSAFGIMAQQYASTVERRSNGQITIEIYPDGQLVTQQGAMEGLATGVIDFAMVGHQFLEVLFPAYSVLDLPFLFRDLNTAFRILDGPIGQSMPDLESKGVLRMNWTNAGFKDLETTTAVVRVPADMKGLRVRIQGGASVLTYQTLGALPVTIDQSELMASLAQRTVDAMDQYIEGFATSKFYTYCKHVAHTQHFFTIVPLFGSKKKIEALPAALQKIVKDEARDGVRRWRQLFAGRLPASIETCKQNGVTFNEIDYPAFRKAVEPVYAAFRAKYGSELLDQVLRATGSG